MKYLFLFLLLIFGLEKYSTGQIVNAVTVEPGLCDGILGAPSSFTSFGSGPNYGPALPQGTTTYVRNPTCLLAPNQYSITNNVNSPNFCNTNWHTLQQDHTPNDVNGYMMLVDANSQPGVFYRARVTGLQADFPYEFSAWAGNMNANNAGCGTISLARLTFSIYTTRGVVLQEIDTGEMPVTGQFQWNKYGAKFKMPPGITEVDIVISTRGRGSCGNDLVIDDLSFAPCYPPLIASFVNGQLLEDKRVCGPGPIELFSFWPPTGNPLTNPSFKWQYHTNINPTVWVDIPNSNSLNITFNIPDRVNYGFRVIAFETNDPSISLTSNTIGVAVIRVIIDYDQTTINLCQGNSLTLPVSARLENVSTNDPSYTWIWTPGTNLSATNIANPIFTAPSAIPPPPQTPDPPPPSLYNYIVKAITVDGCIGERLITVPVKNPRMVAVPNIFSPNNDGINDYFRPKNLEDYYPGYRFEVFNRWGQRVFLSDGPDYRWDGRINGTLQGDGDTFVWQITGGTSGCQIFSITPGYSGTVEVYLR